MYDPGRVDLARVVAPPYDVISPADQRRYYEQDPHNVVRLIAGEVLPTDSDQDNKYLRAARFFSAWLAEGILRREQEAGLCLYRHEFTDPTSGERKSRQGIIGVVQLEPFGNGILPHERTHARAKADRLSLTRSVQANLSPIFSLYEDPERALNSVIEPEMRRRPRLSIDTEDGDRHLVWAFTDPAVIAAAARVLAASRLYVADGHHRYETAVNFRNKMRSEHPEAPADAAFNYVLMLLVDKADPGLTILPTHRLLHNVERFEESAFLAQLSGRYAVTPRTNEAALLDAMREPLDYHRIGLALPSTSSATFPSPLAGEGQGGGLQAGRGLELFTVDVPKRASSDPVSELDVSVLHREVLEQSLGLAEADLESERYVSYSRDLDAVIKRVAEGTAQAVFLLRAPAVADVVRVASAWQLMPQKSTYFYPKPASGIVFNPLDPAIHIPAV
jgi:uncharacterized protein (DUF1015 family)